MIFPLNFTIKLYSDETRSEKLKIDFSKLPNQFVLKCTHDSGGLILCKEKYAKIT